MRYAILDNSTMTAVQRLLGEIELENTTSIDGDIAAFETLIQTILFYDAIFYIDDYKPEFREARQKSFPYLIPLSIGSIPYDSISQASSAFVDDLILKVKGGRIDPNEIGRFFDALRMHTTFTWDMRSSNWFLTMKMLEGFGGLDLEKYSALNSMIFLELSANRETNSLHSSKKPFNLVGSNGAPIADTRISQHQDHEITAQIKAFAASLNWLAARTSFYTFLSYHYEADAILHPIRSAFQLTLASRLGLKQGVFSPIIKRLSDETTQVIKDITDASDPIISEMDIPLFSAWLVGKTGGPRSAIDAAFYLRQENPFLEARQHLINLDQVSKDPSRKHFIQDVNRLVNDVKKAGDTLRQIYGVKTKNGVSISPLISIYNVVGKLKGLPSLPSVPIKIPLPDKVLEIGIRGGFKGVCRSVVQDLVAIERLGEYHEKLTSEVRYKNGKVNTYLAKTEDVHFLGRSSHWKKPM